MMPAMSAEPGWIATRLPSADQDLNTVFFLDSKRGWIGGDDGFLSRTDDGGRTWVRQDVGISNAINDIYFRDKEDGFLIAGNTILVTSDSGTRWTQARRFLPAEFDGAAVELYSVRFSSKNKGWVVGSISKGDRVIDSILVYTDDAGASWQRQRVPSKSELIHIDFDNDRRGWIIEREVGDQQQRFVLVVLLLHANRPVSGDRLIDIMIRTCNGRLTAAEALGHREFVLTKLYRSA